MNPDARSPVGAEGLAQFMPGTWGDVTKAMGWGLVPRREAKYAIEGGAWYQASLRKKWSAAANRSIDDRNDLALASYNAGYGWITKAQSLCGGGPKKPLTWEEISVCLPQVTGHHSKETLTYVININKWMLRKEAGGFG